MFPASPELVCVSTTTRCVRRIAIGLQVPCDILVTTTCCCRQSINQGVPSPQSSSTCDVRHIPQAIFSRSASDFAASTRAMSGWITCMFDWLFVSDSIIDFFSFAFHIRHGIGPIRKLVGYIEVSNSYCYHDNQHRCNRCPIPPPKLRFR